MSSNRTGPLEMHRGSAEWPVLALSALSDLARQFASNTDFHQLIRSLILTLSGQFSVANAFAALHRPGFPGAEAVFAASGKYESNLYLKTLVLTPAIEKYFLTNSGPQLVAELELPEDCAGYAYVLKDCEVEAVAPLIQNDKVLGMIGLGKRVAGKPFTLRDFELLNTILSTTAPLVASSYHLYELAGLSTWYRDILNNVKQGVLVLDPELRLREVNASGYAILSLFSENLPAMNELRGLSLSDVFPESVCPDWTSRLTKHAVEESGKRLVEDLVVSLDGSNHEYEAYITAIQADTGYQNDFIITLDEVTERKEAERKRLDLTAKLKKAEKMESLAVLAGGVAHDLNNMLGALVGYPELMLMKLPEDSKLREYVKLIGNAAEQAADVVQDLLTLARRGRYEMSPTNLNEVVKSYVDSPSYRRVRQRHPNVELELKLDDSNPHINGSATHLSKLVMNLLVNASEAMPDGGKLTVETSQQHLDSLLSSRDKLTEGDYVLLRVRDTGMGIDPAHVEKIFEPYYSSKQMGTSGSGLGLAVVYGVLKDHGGYHDIFSKLGEGTEFVFYFPALAVGATVDDEAESCLPGEENILVVDDVETQRQIASDLLSGLGYQVETVSSGREAVQYCSSKSADLVVLDMVMEEDFDGLNTYRELIKQHPAQKAVIVSGYSADKRVTQVQKLGAGKFVKKPFTLRALGRAVREELDR